MNKNNHTPSTEEREARQHERLIELLLPAYKAAGIDVSEMDKAIAEIERIIAATAKASEEAVIEARIDEWRRAKPHLTDDYVGGSITSSLEDDRGSVVWVWNLEDYIDQRIADLRKSLNIDQEGK